ncbi:unnamed protein product [Medioppia subpectinata]|uniref:Uncharacterized protein n=1 Tax=Medioppia subpectinata TaxID=1979941 RepID=A0A7R9KSQ0_9ACAR|nr:unnamed protein product [Medioppia subpectinata]CAG2109086.1 unnamed protein product [Medioppia subpectinata]
MNPILDLMSDYGCVLYGQSGAYGMLKSWSVEKMLIKDPAKNSNLDRDKGLVSKNSFKLEVSGGTFSNSEITAKMVWGRLH